MAIVRAPGGRKYDTVRRVFLDESIGNSSSTAYIPNNTETVIRRPRSNSFWGRINNFISGIGDWFDYNGATFSDNISFIFYIIAWISLGIGVIGQWISSGFWTALITGVIGGIIVYYAAGIAMVILMYVLYGCFKVMRYVFYNVYTLLIAIAIVAAIIFSNQINISQNKTTSISNPVSNQPNYYCDVNTTLRVREYPRANAKVLGQLKKNEEVYVYSIENNFAKIDFDGRIAYASAEYLKLKTGTIPGSTNTTLQKPSPATVNNGNAKINDLIGTSFTGYKDQRALQDKLGFWCGNQLEYGGGKFSIERWENAKEQKLWLVLMEKIDNNKSSIRDILPFERKSIGDIGTFPVYNKNTKQWSDYMMVQVSPSNELVKIYNVDLQNGKIISNNPESYWGEVQTEWDSY